METQRQTLTSAWKGKEKETGSEWGWQKRYRERKDGRQIDRVAVAWWLNRYNLSTLVCPECCDSPVPGVGSVLYFSYSAPPRLPELPADWCGKRHPRSHPRWQRWKVGRCGKRPYRLQWAEEHLCLLVGSPVGHKRGEFNIFGERRRSSWSYSALWCVTTAAFSEVKIFTHRTRSNICQR